MSGVSTSKSSQKTTSVKPRLPPTPTYEVGLPLKFALIKPVVKPTLLQRLGIFSPSASTISNKIAASSIKNLEQSSQCSIQPEQKIKKDHGPCKSTNQISLNDPYWKPCLAYSPDKNDFTPGTFYVDRFLLLSDQAEVRIRYFEDGTVCVSRKGQTIVLKEPEGVAEEEPFNRCEQCSMKIHTIQRCPQITCCCCEKKGHVGTICPEPESRKKCLACGEKEHNHNERASCARWVHSLKNVKACGQCGSRGHSESSCMQIRCSLCGTLGHIGNFCEKQARKPAHALQVLPDTKNDESIEAVLRSLICVRIGNSIYSAELNENQDLSEINPTSVRIEGFNGFSPTLRLPIKVGTIVHEVSFRVNQNLLVPISLGKEAMRLFDIRVFVGETQINS